MNDNCIFCKIASKQIEAKIIGENDLAIAFLDINPISDGHVLIIPKKHYENFVKCDSQYLTSVNLLAQQIAKKIELSNLKPLGFNFLSNMNKIAGQEIFHFHIHVIPKYDLNDGLLMSSNRNHKYDVEKVYELFTNN